ncbi:MAG: hypothetical protein ABJN40_13405 [Sneathiella sp.]
MSKYAERTTVSSDQSKAEIERTLSRYGATGFMYGWDETSAVIMFKTSERQVKFALPLPDRNDRAFTHTEVKKERRSPESTDKAYEQAVKQRWRALALVVKAKLEAVETGITGFDQEFMAHIVLPDGRTAGEVMIPEIALSYETGDMPPMLPAPGGD